MDYMNENRRNSRPLSTQEQHEKQILSLRLQMATLCSVDFIINDSVKVRTNNFPSLKKLQDSAPELLNSTYLNWLEVNQESSSLQDVLDEQWLPYLISGNESNALMKQDNHRWDVHHFFSRIGFSSDDKQALVYHEMYCSGGVPQCGTMYFFEFHFNLWKQKGSFGVFNQ
ncbi:MAG: hypothetical protein ACHBN1_19460 [Heteroscytonema crispum UTEX LB 1556]